MRIFDRIRFQDIDRRDWQLWVLAITMILILSAGIVLVTYSSYFVQAFSFSGIAVERFLFAFCILSLLFVAYLIQRQLLIRRLRKELTEERKRNIQLRGQASLELLKALSGLEHFRDRLAMELLRAVGSQQPLSLLTIRLEARPTLAADDDVPLAYGDAVKLMMGKIRGEDSIYHSGEDEYAVILPRTSTEEARSVSTRLAGGLAEAAGVSKRFSFDIEITDCLADPIPEAIKKLYGMEAEPRARRASLQ
jgi:GGDEF domain-containing protein